MNAMSDEIAVMLSADRQEEAYRHHRELFTQPLFAQDWRARPTDPGRRAYERYLRLLPKLRPMEAAFDVRELVTLTEWATTVDPHLALLLSVQVNLALGTLTEYSPLSGEPERTRRRMLEGRAVGSYVVTELGHGSDLNNVETIAEFDTDTREFVLTTPSSTAVKFMSSTAPPPLAGVSRFGVVLARLRLWGEDRGPYAFLVHLTAPDGTVLPGVTIRRLPDKPVLGIDNALTRFDGVRVGLDCLLSPEGTHVTPEGELVEPLSENNRTWRAISRVRTGRIAAAAMAAAAARASLSIAVRHAAQREIESKAGGRIPLAHVRSHHGRLLDVLAETYVATLAVREASSAFAGIPDEYASGVTDEIALTKYFVTTVAARACDEARERLGAQGAFAHNRIVEYRALRDAVTTADGDSQVGALHAAYRRLALAEEKGTTRWDPAQPCGADTPDRWLSWLAVREEYLHRRARRLHATSRGDAQVRWDRTSHAALAAAEAHAAYKAADALSRRTDAVSDATRRVLHDLLTLFAVRQCQSHGADLLPDGPFPALTEPLPAMADRLHDRLAPHLRTLTEAFELPTGLLGTPFEAPEGFVSYYARALDPAGE
ncbi:acyl-CoA dehydrogenase family protein [Streptomyces acidiscabies]|uniref:acyl-CoA dehydrogenase family protein n=1 Tax=Streptomyces acidiscabies TaxID=42234 RepID=UPI0009526B40|nr:acyl-CoA dehydrogenase family protein [Streptomyces acidiscabies]